MSGQIEDYLQTQGLRLPRESVQMAQLAAQTVMQQGQAAIERSLLWREEEGVRVADEIGQTPENESCLKQIFMALDSFYSRQNVRSAAVYAALPEQTRLLRLAQQGEAQPFCLDSDGDVRRYLSARTAQTGWLNLTDNAARWLEYGELEGSHNLNALSQISVPVCDENGRVYGVVHVEHVQEAAFDEEAQTDWVGLALALLAPLQQLVSQSAEAENQPQ